MKKWMFFLLLICSIGLVGCLGTEVQEKKLDKKVTEIDQQLEANAKDRKNKKTVETKPTVINIVDPNTSEVIKTFSPKELWFDTNYEEYESKIKEIAKELASGTETTPGYDQRMKLDKIGENGEILKGNPLVVLKESELVDKILKTSFIGGVVELPLYITNSNYNPDEISTFGEMTVASYTTYFDPSKENRNKNIELSAKALNNVIVGIGDYFSFNTIVGPRDKENGYQPAPEIINKKLVMGIGGGVCQTSSTLFNAVDQIQVKYLEKHHHSINIGYVPKGRDATVSYGTLDFRFQNMSDAPLLIKTIYGKSSLTIEVRTSKTNAEKLLLNK
ncbi:VanW family protein [Rummeliibacillus pycnus]|uniref:VanW family protein n=1 Tax=Rummeliibacillus pycnus TaxID=101070 RepID=UPI0037C6383A